MTQALNLLLKFVDPQKQTVIETNINAPGGLDIRTEQKEESLGDDLQAYTLVDIQTMLAAAVTDDLTGLVLAGLQAKWNRDLSIDETKNITIHLTKLIQLLT